MNAEMSLEKQDLQAKLENERTSMQNGQVPSKNLVKLIDSSMTVRTKSGLGCDEYIGENELGWDDSEFSVFTPTPEDVEGKPLYNRFVKTDRMKAVPPPLSGNYIPLSDPTDLDESQMTYGPKQTHTSDSEPKTSDLDSCESNSSVESLESMPKPVIIEPKTSEYASCFINVGKSSKKDNLSTSNSFSTLNDDEEDVENVPDEYANLIQNTKAGGSSSFTAAAGHWNNAVGDCYMINIYGPQETPTKSSLWNRIAEFMHQHNGKFILFGDMNIVRHKNERAGSLFSRNEAGHFNSFIDSSGLIDLPIGGISEDIPDIRVTAIDHMWSDHTPILLHAMKSDFGPSPFKYGINCELMEQYLASSMNKTYKFTHAIAVIVWRPRRISDNHRRGNITKSSNATSGLSVDVELNEDPITVFIDGSPGH
ncbi:RNA-directed DNA polymerase, eukaryota, reverse transcriptase zinc-binding domain protein [Tanacetum coccineum]|uniref:RNA-directed DNA polymerase, eukaryota, reverse transcriptase zinc-binding domain protein n=1 Tax=Tanacetum coccineum TaxID=301880 RepID=A0ABQ5HV45_9ASTR